MPNHKWKSIVVWDPKLGFQDNETVDYHDTKEAAEAVCRMIQRQGLGGEGIHFPVKTRVESLKTKEEIEKEKKEKLKQEEKVKL